MSSDTMLSRSDGRKTELRFEVQPEEVAVLDGYCSATGRNRTDVVRQLLAEWSEKKLHQASVICRVAGVNPIPPESRRHE